MSLEARTRERDPSQSAPGARAGDLLARPPRREVSCRACGHLVTHVDAAIEVDGGHTHTFANPAGFVFEIACYRDAPGTVGVGEPSLDFTWFAGHTWQSVVCAACHAHLGWCFRRQGTGHHGLIRERLAEQR